MTVRFSELAPLFAGGRFQWTKTFKSSAEFPFYVEPSQETLRKCDASALGSDDCAAALFGMKSFHSGRYLCLFIRRKDGDGGGFDPLMKKLK